MYCKLKPADVYDPNDKGGSLSRKKAAIACLPGCSRCASDLKDVIRSSARHGHKKPPLHQAVATLRPDFFVSSPLYGALHCEDFYDFSTLVCTRCEVNFATMDALQAHHHSRHAVTQLVEGDSSRTIVEIIFNANRRDPSKKCAKIEKILKICILRSAHQRFEEYRQTVISREANYEATQPRCKADGNELLRFHGCSVACDLGGKLCGVAACGVCRILREGFCGEKVGKVGVYTASSSGWALESVEAEGRGRKAVLLCRVIAGSVCEWTETAAEDGGWDSVAVKDGYEWRDLYVKDERALLPCYVVICTS